MDFTRFGATELRSCYRAIRSRIPALFLRQPPDAVPVGVQYLAGELRDAVQEGAGGPVLRCAFVAALEHRLGVAPGTSAVGGQPLGKPFGKLQSGWINLAAAAQKLDVQLDALRGAGAKEENIFQEKHTGTTTQGRDQLEAAINFARRSDVFTVSIHADPTAYYPFVWGYAHERGEGAGLGANLNIPLPLGTKDDGYMQALNVAAKAIKAFAPGALVVALGLDASEHDPLKGLAVTTDGFRRIGEAIARMGLPTVFVQEGGYLSDILGQNLTAVLGGFEAAR